MADDMQGAAGSGMSSGARSSVSFDVDYPGPMDRMTSFFRLIWAIPIVVLLGLITNAGVVHYTDAAGKAASSTGGITAGLFVATVLMLVVRRRYPRWWFDFGVELARFSARVTAYLLLLTDRYPSTTDAQSVHLEVTYPDAERLHRWLPLVKWLLVIPHLIVLAFLSIGVVVVTIIAWFAILFTGNYPRGLFDFTVGVGRWATRVWAYAFLLITDAYPPFSLH
jgi:hypothetical protein